MDQNKVKQLEKKVKQCIDNLKNSSNELRFVLSDEGKHKAEDFYSKILVIELQTDTRKNT